MNDINIKIARALGSTIPRGGYHLRRAGWNRRMFVACTEQYTNPIESTFKELKIPSYPYLTSDFAWLPIKTEDNGWVWLRRVFTSTRWGHSIFGEVYFSNYIAAQRHFGK